MHHFLCAGGLFPGKIFQALTVANSKCKSICRLNHYSALIIGNGNKETEWDSSRWHIYLCEHVTENYFKNKSLWVVHCISIQPELVHNETTWHVLYFCLWCRYTGMTGGIYVTQDKVWHIYMHMYTSLQTLCMHTNSHTVMQAHALRLYVCAFPHHLCFIPSAKILSSKIWLDIFQHWISRESRLARRWILLERHRKREEEREGESSLFHKRPRLEEDIYLPPVPPEHTMALT